MADVLKLVGMADRYNIPLDWFYRGELGATRHDLAEKIEKQMKLMHDTEHNGPM